ncbi:MAG: hypothetical protein RIQ71_2647, partial [Verrucomicrobiota bacterium]
MKLRRIVSAFVALLLLAAAATILGANYLTPLLGTWVAGPAFNRILSQAVSHALKVDGQFGPMALQPDLTVKTSGFASKGWPGQAIGALNTGEVRGRFCPWGILRG